MIYHRERASAHNTPAGARSPFVMFSWEQSCYCTILLLQDLEPYQSQSDCQFPTAFSYVSRLSRSPHYPPLHGWGPFSHVLAIPWPSARISGCDGTCSDPCACYFNHLPEREHCPAPPDACAGRLPTSASQPGVEALIQAHVLTFCLPHCGMHRPRKVESFSKMATFSLLHRFMPEAKLLSSPAFRICLPVLVSSLRGLSPALCPKLWFALSL